jgi:hypothetical protein
MSPADETAELKAAVEAFFRAVSFESGQTPDYAAIRELFIDGGKLIRASSEIPEISSVEAFITSRQSAFDSGALTSFAEVEITATSEVFGNVAHRFSTYEKRGTLHGEPIEGSGLISTQFVRISAHWKISSMAWDDERAGLTIPDRYRRA